MRPSELATKIFLDSGDPAETKEAITLLGFLDGQTTNPTLVAKNPVASARLARGEKFSRHEIEGFYQTIVQEISRLIPQGSVSVEIYADHSTDAATMIREAQKLSKWIPNAHIKLPTTAAGLEAAHKLIADDIRVNMTLVFSQSQAAAVHAATSSAQNGQVYLSPFVGRLDDIEINGMDLIKNILMMYRAANSHVAVLTASVRSLDHLLYALTLGSDIITAPLAVLKAWVKTGLIVAGNSFQYQHTSLKPIPYEELDCNQPWQSFQIQHELTHKGIQKFADDWNALVV